MALALLIVLPLLTLASCYFFGQSWLPLLASAQGANIDHQFKLDLIVLGIVFVVTQLALALFVWKYRERNVRQRSGPSPDTTARTEITWLAIATILFLGTNLIGSTLWADGDVAGRSASPKPVHVEVNAVQFRWYFRYPGPDGKF